MSDIKKVIRKLIKDGKRIEISANVKECGNTGEYYLPDSELEQILKANPDYIRAGIEYQKVDGKKVWLPYYLTKGYFTSNHDMLMPIKINPIFP